MSEKMPVAVGEFVLVELFDPEDRKSKGGIFLPASAVVGEKPTMEVASKGSKVDIPIEAGDRIELSEGIRINWFYGPEEKKLGVIHQKYIAAVYKGE